MKNIRPTSARGVAALLKRGEKGQYSAGENLYLSVNGANSGSWVFRYKFDGKTRRMGIGRAGDGGLALSEARARANELRTLLAKGLDPIAERDRAAAEQEARSISFKSVAHDYIEAKRSEWRREKQGNDWWASLSTYAFPTIGHLPPAEVTTELVLEILRPIWDKKHETARKVRNRIEVVLNSAKARKLREGENVAAWRGHLELMLPSHRRQQRHHPALPYEQMPMLWEALKRSSAMAAPPLMFKILTAVRADELRGATWDEISIENKMWTIPGERMKVYNDHRVPLSQPAIDLLQSLPRPPSGLVFEGQKDGVPISDMTMVMLLRRMDAQSIKDGGKGWRSPKDEVIVPHGFRSSIRDWMAEETATPNHVAEQVLAHAIGDAVEAAYRRGDLLKKRREVMELWASYVTGGNVVPLVREV